MYTPHSGGVHLVRSSSPAVNVGATLNVEKRFRDHERAHADSSHRIDRNLGNEFSFERISDPSQRSMRERALIESMQTGGNL